MKKGKVGSGTHSNLFAFGANFIGGMYAASSERVAQLPTWVRFLWASTDGADAQNTNNFSHPTDPDSYVFRLRPLLGRSLNKGFEHLLSST